ncbi:MULTISPECIES: DUF6199 family natural product biosynthesis protein [Streptomyces]|uniref:DUF6199 family natural product biosynthesis protein n=1 Tax=Streptomyces sp. SYP-A7185 TaxID=3040076 RepID=UPI0038F8027D
MSRDAVFQAASDGGGSPVLIPFLCVFLVMGLVQVIRPQLLWKLNRSLQRGWVKDPDGTEPTSRGYAMTRVSGVLVLGFVTWMLVQQI